MVNTAVRRKHAVQELFARGVIKKEKMPFFIALMMAIFRGQANPYYGSRLLYGCQLGFFFALPFVVMISAAFHFDKELQLPIEQALMIGVGIGGIAGIGFGTALALFKRSVHTRLKLSPWEKLDTPPMLENVENAVSFEQVNSEWEAVAGVASLGGTVARRGIKQ